MINIDNIFPDFTAEILKGGKPAAIGEIREFGGKKYKKTSNGWRPVPKKERSTEQKSIESSSIPTTIEEALKMVDIDRTSIIESAKKSVSLPYSAEDLKENEWRVGSAKKGLEQAIKLGDLEQIKKTANNLAKAKLYEEEFAKALKIKKAERKKFIDSTSNDFTEEQVREYLDKYITEKDPRAIVNNKWSYFMGSIGSTSATISVGEGKFKNFNDFDFPSWRPIGMIEYSVRSYGGGYDKISIPVQNWKDIKKELSSTENFTLRLYKHPKQ